MIPALPWPPPLSHPQFPHHRCPQVYYSLLVFGTILVSIVVLSAIQYQSCWSYLDSSLGAMPVQVGPPTAALWPDLRCYA